jgi:DNA-binding response OmpR family regulator
MEKKETVILCVDDDAHILELLTYVLEGAGYTVINARSGFDAIALAISRKPSLVLLDLILPDIPGEEVCRRLKKHASTSEIPIIVLTVKSDELDMVRALELGADDYVTKPFSVRVLVARINALLRRREMGPPRIPEDNET